MKADGNISRSKGLGEILSFPNYRQTSKSKYIVFIK